MSAQMKRLNIADEKFSGKKAFGFSLVRLGNILAGLMIGEVTYFATNSLALTAAAISTGVAIKTAIDAVTDLIMGTIVDRTHTKYGKARPYVLAGILMWITLIACFAVPTSWFAGMAPERRNLWMVVYITVFNALHSAIFSTIVNIAYETHIKRSIVKEENRIKSLTVIGIIYAVGSLVLQMVLPAIINIFHGSQTGFVLMAVVTAIFGIIACIVCFFLCPEYTEEELAAFGGYDVEEANKKIPISEFLKDVLKNIGKKNFKVKNVVKDAYFVSQTRLINEVFKELQKNKMQIAIIIDEYGGTAGLITMEDILEELVGDIYDEYDKEEKEFEKIDENTYIIVGSMPIYDVNKLLNANIPEGDYDTLSGFLQEKLGRIPEEEENPIIETKEVTYKIEKYEDKRILKVKACKNNEKQIEE